MIKNINNKRLNMAHRLAKWFDYQAPKIRGVRRLRNQLTKLVAPTFTPPQTISTRYDFNLELTTNNDNIDRELYYRGSYEAGTLHVIEKCLGPNDIFLDIGANIGLMSLFASKCVGSNGHVYSFEPEPYNYNLLKKNLSLNEAQNVATFQVGLGSTSDSITIFKNQDHNRGTSSFIKHTPEATETAIVEVKQLDDFLADNNIDSIKMMKIDVEGWELEVLKGALSTLSNPTAPIICIEYNTSFPNHKEIYTFLTTINEYKIYILSNANWAVSRLIEIQSFHDLPLSGSPNLYCFLPVHLNSVSEELLTE